VGTLNLGLEMPDPMDKESAQSDQPAGRKRPKSVQILGYFVVYQISKIGPHVSDTSLEYPQHISVRTLKFHFLGG
jgi:hypothetical protein